MCTIHFSLKKCKNKNVHFFSMVKKRVLNLITMVFLSWADENIALERTMEKLSKLGTFSANFGVFRIFRKALIRKLRLFF